PADVSPGLAVSRRGGGLPERLRLRGPVGGYGVDPWEAGEGATRAPESRGSDRRHERRRVPHEGDARRERQVPAGGTATAGAAAECGFRAHSGCLGRIIFGEILG